MIPVNKKLTPREERAAILQLLTRQLMEDKCTNLEVLKQVDRLCRRTWTDIHRGWVSWGFYLETLLGGLDKYNEWAKLNCEKLSLFKIENL